MRIASAIASWTFVRIVGFVPRRSSVLRHCRLRWDGSSFTSRTRRTPRAGHGSLLPGFNSSHRWRPSGPEEGSELTGQTFEIRASAAISTRGITRAVIHPRRSDDGPPARTVLPRKNRKRSPRRDPCRSFGRSRSRSPGATVGLRSLCAACASIGVGGRRHVQQPQQEGLLFEGAKQRASSCSMSANSGCSRNASAHPGPARPETFRGATACAHPGAARVRIMLIRLRCGSTPICTQRPRDAPRRVSFLAEKRPFR